MLNIVKKYVKSSKKNYGFFLFLLNLTSLLKLIVRYPEMYLNYLRIKFNLKVHLRSLSMYRDIDQKEDIKKILLDQIFQFKMNSKKEEPFLVLEIGSLIADNIEFIGKILDKKLKHFLIICIDPYEDYINNADKKKFSILKFRSNYTNLLYKYFLHNISILKYRKNIVHLRDYSKNGMILLQKLMLKFDFIYVDGAHYYKNIKEDFMLSKTLIKKNNKYSGAICGDDYSVHINDYKNFNLNKIEFAKLLRKNINREFITLKHLKKDGFGSTGFHPGITLFFSQIRDNVLKKKSGIWVLDKK
jgi:hypothetical protein